MKNLSSVEMLAVDFFITGNEYIRDGLNLKFIPHKHADIEARVGGANLADVNQDLQQSYLIAKKVFEHVELGTIKFVLIGLAPYAVSENDKKSPIVLPLEVKILEDYIKLCVDNGAKPFVVVLPVRQSLRKIYKADVLKLFRDRINRVVKKYNAAFIDLLDVKLVDSCFQDKMHLNSEGGAAVGALLSEKLYLNNIISLKEITACPTNFFDVLSKYFPNDYKKLTHRIFCKMACGHFKVLSEILPQDVCKDTMAQVFSEMTYDHLAILSDMLSKDDYNDLAARIFKISAEKIRRKDRIKVGFVLYLSAEWCGDDLYNLFADDERFETSIFLCMRIASKENELFRKDFLHGIEQFKSHNLNVVPVDGINAKIPTQDVLIFLVPYFNHFPRVFRPANLTAETLIIHIPYSFDIAIRSKSYYNLVIFRVSWKIFFSSVIGRDVYVKNSAVGLPRSFFSGYSRMDIFFEKSNEFHFDWKMVRPNAKKIIWAPHWSINSVTRYATFQWNFQFMYEFAKTHLEFSWIVKPHPGLFFSAVQEKVFPSMEAFKEYLQRWDKLPNAQVYTGGYYQALFATSDAMIHDSGSFIAEYQFVDKPMIFLTREGEKFNDLGSAILGASYLVDGKNFEAIAITLKKILIEGNDDKATERKAVFDKYLNYPKANGMLASEFIYKSIADELK